MQKPISLVLFLLSILSASPIAHAVDEEFVPPMATVLRNSHIRIDRNYVLTETLENIRLIRNDEAAQENGNWKIGFQPSLGESVKILDAYTIGPRGEKYPVAKSDIKVQRKDIDSQSLEFGDDLYMVVIYPRVQAGSRLYIKYEMVNRKTLWEGNITALRLLTPHHEWQEAKYVIEFPQGLPIRVAAEGFSGGETGVTKGVKRYEFFLKNPTPVEMESGSVSSRDYAPIITISSFQSWQELGRAYAVPANKKINITPAIRAQVEEITRGLGDRREQIAAIYRWVQSNIKYVSDIVERGGVIPNDTRRIFDKRIGDCKDHSLMMVAMLRVKGIDATTALVNLGDAYAMRGVPTLASFNHAISYIPEFDMYLDSTSRFSRFGQLDDEVRGKPTLLTDSGVIGKTPSATPEMNISKTSVQIKILPDGTIKGETLYTPLGNFEISQRLTRSANTFSRTREQAAEALKKQGESGVGQIRVSDLTAMDKPLEVTATYTLDPLSNIPGAGALRLPSGMIPAHLRGIASPGNNPEPTLRFPSPCSSKTVEEDYQIEFPPTVAITRLPKDVELRDGPWHYKASYEKIGNKVIAKRRYVFNFAESVCGDAENTVWKKVYPVVRQDLLSQIFYE